MKKSDIVFYTDLILDKVSEDFNHDREFIEKLYYFYTEELKTRIKENDDVAYYIPKFGTIYLTLTGANYTLKELGRLKLRLDKIQPIIERTERKRDLIKEYIGKLKENGNSKIAYFDKIFNPNGIKNG